MCAVGTPDGANDKRKRLMTLSSINVCRVLVPSGVIGSGCPQEAFDRGMSLKPDAIAVDGGSTDSGPYYLGEGVSKMTRKATKRDLRQMMIGRAQLGIPLIIGSCGTSGTDAGVRWMADICEEIAREEGQTVRVALIFSEQAVDEIIGRVSDISPLAPTSPITAERIAECDHIVGLLGFEPLAAAIADGADIVLAGRATDTAVLAAVPLMRGLPPAQCWHAAKIAECGGLCTTHSRQGGVFLTIDEGGFNVEPLDAGNSCTPYSVSAHMLYENVDPYQLTEPGIVLDTREARYESLDDRTVRVTGSDHRDTPYTMKLEGSGSIGYRTMIFTAIAEPKIMVELDGFIDRLRAHMVNGIEGTLGYGKADYDLAMRAYGAHALSPPGAARHVTPPREVGLMTLVTSSTQEMATEIAKYCNPFLLHYPQRIDTPLPSYAFPFSPAEVELGKLYEFKLNHVIALASPGELARTKFLTVGSGVEREYA